VNAGGRSTSAVSGALFPIGFVLFVAAFSQAKGLVEVGGLIQRLTVSVGWAWLTLLAVHLARTPLAPRSPAYADESSANLMPRSDETSGRHPPRPAGWTRRCARVRLRPVHLWLTASV